MPSVHDQSVANPSLDDQSSRLGHVKEQLGTPAGAYGLAWAVWIVYLMVPLFIFMGVVFHMLIHTHTLDYEYGNNPWFIWVMLWLAVTVPGAYFLRARFYFHGYWSGRPATPREYFLGMLLVWTAIEIGGILALLGCLFTGELMPNIIPALIAFVLFTTQWPNASAMTDSTGDQADASIFRHPR